MSDRVNHLGQPIGYAVDDWRPCPHPRGSVMAGRLCQLVPIDADRDAPDLAAAFAADREGRNWTYLSYGPLEGAAQVRAWIETTCVGDDPCFFSVIDHAFGRSVGVASYLRIQPEVGVVEVGHIHFSSLMQRSTLATEAMYLMMRRVFEDLGYRRYEWKCDALNEPSRRAALRLGFRFEGIFRQATLYKKRNRDTAWYAITDRDWPRLRSAFAAWLDASNFDADGRQRSRLSEATAAASREP